MHPNADYYREYAKLESLNTSARRVKELGQQEFMERTAALFPDANGRIRKAAEERQRRLNDTAEHPWRTRAPRTSLLAGLGRAVKKAPPPIAIHLHVMHLARMNAATAAEKHATADLANELRGKYNATLTMLDVRSKDQAKVLDELAPAFDHAARTTSRWYRFYETPYAYARTQPAVTHYRVHHAMFHAHRAETCGYPVHTHRQDRSNLDVECEVWIEGDEVCADAFMRVVTVADAVKYADDNALNRIVFIQG